MKKIIIQSLKTILIVYILFCLILYFLQEKIIFQPDKLSKNYRFVFTDTFEEITIKAKDGALLNGLLFKANNAKGLIFYLHGNAGSLASWGDVAKTYTNLNYDIFILDYRGYGKSEGKIKNENQIFDDTQAAYNLMKARYSEKDIIILGYSIGTGPAAKLASSNCPKKLILQAPYYSLTEVMKDKLPLIPTLLLRYKFTTYKYLSECQMPVVIFHGNEDQLISYHSSLKLKAFLKPGDLFITLPGQGHNGMTDNKDYKETLRKLLK